MIVKVQRSIVTSCAKPQVLVYNRTSTCVFQGPLTKAVRKLLGKRLKAFFHATLVANSDGWGYTFALGKEAPWQKW